MVKTLKSSLALLCLLFWFYGCNEVEEVDIDPPMESTTWNLIFEEEFTNLNSWNTWYGGAFNNEIQLYRPEQLVIENGILKVNAQRESISGPTNPFDNNPKNFEYVSGRIESKQTFGPSATEGGSEYRFMARIKLPKGQGMWPAFWTYGDPWPTQGEIDILEARGNEPNTFQSNIFYGTEPNVNINSDTEAVHSIGQNLTDNFHVYEMIWRENSIDILFDEELIHTYMANSTNNIRSLFGKKQKIVLNTAVGGLFFSDTNSSNYADNSTMEIDWVRVYKK